MADSRQDVLAAALAYLGTPYQHQGRAPGKGLDCAGVVECAYRAAGYELPLHHNYARQPDGVWLKKTVEHHFARTNHPVPGDVMLIGFYGVPHHVAIFNDRTMIHAYSAIGRCVQHLIDAKWKRLTGGFYTWRF